MNIEEERKAFAEWYSDNQDTPLVDVWLAAKAHAAEMAKPTCIVFETMADTFTVQYFDNGRPTQERGFKNEVLAVQWAKDKGYRVIE